MPKRASGRYPVQPITPLGPDQVNVLLFSLHLSQQWFQPEVEKKW
jgi:hypothetical protein